MSDRADSFEWAGGHAALDFVNTVDERPFPSPIENLATYADLVKFVELAELVEPALASELLRLDGGACSRVVEGARTLREHLYDILMAAHSERPPHATDFKAISAAIQASHAARVLVTSPAPGLASHCWSPPVTHDIPLHACSLAIEHLLVDQEQTRIRKCAASDCNVFFVDTSKMQRRHWCSMRGCGNREKQRRWRSAPP
jgi:predicted RNA-binding Zn ribbon-like protein